jgi:hypothetical protein
MSDKEDYDSDDSLNTEELNELQQAIPQTFGGIERSSKKAPKKEKHVKEPNPDLQPKTQVEEIPEVKEEVKEEPEPPKPKRGRPKKGEEKPKVEVKTKIKRAPKVVEKIIYCVPDFENGGYQKVKVKPLNNKELRKLENEIEADETEIREKTKYLRKVDGKIDNRSRKERTPAQIAATKKLVESRKKALADKKAQKENDKQKQVKEQKEIIKESIEEAVVETVAKPIDEVRADVEERRKKREARIASRQKVKTDDALSRARNLFS